MALYTLKTWENLLSGVTVKSLNEKIFGFDTELN